jgi:L-malate glycosyltransferase
MTAARTILFTHSGQDWVRGSERVLLDLATAIQPFGYRAVVWCDAEALRTACAEARIEVVAQAFPHGVDRPWWRTPRESIRSAAQVIQATGASLVHVNSLECLPWSLRAARKARIPVIAHLHIPTTLEERIWSGLHQATRVVGVSEFVLRWGLRDGVDPAFLRLVHNGVVPERLERGDASALRTSLGIPRSAFVAVTVGSLIPRKDIATVIEGVRLARAVGEDIRLLILGTGEERAQLEAQAGIAGIADKLHFLGDRQDVGAILRDAADLLLSAAREEALPLNLIEAGYFGLPSIVTDIPPHHEIVPGDSHGVLFPVGRADLLAERIVMLARTPVLRRELGQDARNKVRESFLGDRFVAQFTGLYDELTKSDRAQHGWLRGFRFPGCYWRFGLARLTGRTQGTDLPG